MPPVDIPDRFERRLRKKPPQLRKAVAKCVRLLGDNPGHPGLQTHKVRGTPDVWEAYVDRANRVTYNWKGGTIVLRNHCNHDMIDRSP